MSKTITVPLSSLKPWKGPKAHGTQSTPVAQEPPNSPDTQVLKRLKEVSSTLKSLQNRHEINQKVFQELHIPEATYVSTDIPINTLQNLWTQGKLELKEGREIEVVCV